MAGLGCSVGGVVGFVAIGVPGAGLWALLVLMLGIIQLPPTLVILPVIVWVFPNTELVPAIIFTVYSIIVALSDNFLKPILMGRGVDAPMLVIFLGAIGDPLSDNVVAPAVVLENLLTFVLDSESGFHQDEAVIGVVLIDTRLFTAG